MRVSASYLTHTLFSRPETSLLSSNDVGSTAVDGHPINDSNLRNSDDLKVPGMVSLGLRCAEFVRNGGVGLYAGDDAVEL